MEKQFSIVVAGSDEIKDIAISPGASVHEVLNETGLQGYQLSRKGGELLAPETDMFEAVNASEKLYATPQDVSVGVGGSASPLTPGNLKEILYSFIGKNKKRVRVIGNNSAGCSVPAGKARIIATRKHRKNIQVVGVDLENPYWQENGWIEKWGQYKGYYKTNYCKCLGLIEEKYKGNYSFFIFDPPKALKQSSHWACFSRKGLGKYSIHFGQKPRDISSGIIIVEQLINASFSSN